MLTKKDKSTYEKISDLFSENGNRSNLRTYMNRAKLPVIPYLGLYLTDLVYIDVAHPRSGSTESDLRITKMKSILRVISDFQKSSYDYLPIYKNVQHYLISVRYIEELQKFVEDDNYKRSLKIEAPPSSVPTVELDNLLCLPLSHRQDIPSSAHVTPSKAQHHAKHTHRKCKSLVLQETFSSSNKNNDNISNNMQMPLKNLHLLDDSVLEDVSCSPNRSLRQSEEDMAMTDIKEISPLRKLSVMQPDLSDIKSNSFSHEGFLRRKTLIRNGKKVKVSAWRRFWCLIWRKHFFFYAPKSFLGTRRNDFQMDTCKILTLKNWIVQPGEENYFNLIDSENGKAYKLQTRSIKDLRDWILALSSCLQEGDDKGLKDLIDLES